MKENKLAVWRYEIKTQNAIKKSSDLELDILARLLQKELQRRNKK